MFCKLQNAPSVLQRFKTLFKRSATSSHTRSHEEGDSTMTTTTSSHQDLQQLSRTPAITIAPTIEFFSRLVEHSMFDFQRNEMNLPSQLRQDREWRPPRSTTMPEDTTTSHIVWITSDSVNSNGYPKVIIATHIACELLLVGWITTSRYCCSCCYIPSLLSFIVVGIQGRHCCWARTKGRGN